MGYQTDFRPSDERVSAERSDLARPGPSPVYKLTASTQRRLQLLCQVVGCRQTELETNTIVAAGRISLFLVPVLSNKEVG
jgi:hypothetical protein